jgi:hypothetical protein
VSDRRDLVRAHAREHYLPALRRERRSNERALLIAVLFLLRPDGSASLSYDFLAHVTGVPYGKVHAVLAELERFGMLERVRTRGRNLYRVPITPATGPVASAPATVPVAYYGALRRKASEQKAFSDARARERNGDGGAESRDEAERALHAIARSRARWPA